MIYETIIDPTPYEGVAGRDIVLAWAVADTDTGLPSNLSTLTAVVVSLRRQVPQGQTPPEPVRFSLEEGSVSIDLEAGQVTCVIDKASSAPLGHGRMATYDLRLDFDDADGLEPAVLIGVLNVREGF